ncbi:hypothetical protein GmHk_11G031950 [Glycine max]|nr:hypothetical protein GmHk_11G031950 [Glycine max]
MDTSLCVIGDLMSRVQRENVALVESKNFRDLVDDGNQFNGLFYIEREDAQFGDDAWEALLPLEPDVAVVEAKELEDNRDLIDDFFLREGIGV